MPRVSNAFEDYTLIVISGWPILPNFIPRGSLVLSDFPALLNSGFKMASTIGNKVIVYAAETILRVRLLHKVIFYSKEQLFYCYNELRLETSRKERSNRRLSLPLELLEGFPYCSTKNLNKKNRRVYLFYGAGSDRILESLKLNKCLGIISG